MHEVRNTPPLRVKLILKWIFDHFLRNYQEIIDSWNKLFNCVFSFLWQNFRSLSAIFTEHWAPFTLFSSSFHIEQLI